MAGMFMGNLPLEDDAGKDRQSARTLAELLQAEREEFVNNLSDEGKYVTTLVLQALRGEGLYDLDIEPKKENLAEILEYLYHKHDFRIIELTYGKGKHAVDYEGISKKRRVRKNDVFVTIDTTGHLNEFTPAGMIATYKLRYKLIAPETELVVKKRYLHHSE